MSYVYSLCTDSVKKGKFGEFASNKLSNSIVVNGVAYWAASICEFRESEKVIACFDMGNDTIREIMLPPPYSENNAMMLPPSYFEENDQSAVLVENSKFGELLSLYYYDRSTYILDIWVLENAGEPNEVWTKNKSLNFEPSWRPMAFRNNSEIVLRGCRKFLTYDLERKEAKDIVDDNSLDAFYWAGEIYPHPQQGINRFEETLILLDVNRQVKIQRVS